MAIEMSSDTAICSRCGRKYSRRKGYFPVSYAILHKGIGYIPVCKECIDAMYNTYLAQCNNAKDAVRQMCRKLDLYWSESVYEIVSRKSTTRSMMTQYIAKINSVSYAGKSYDDTLSEEGTLWNFNQDIEDDSDYDNSDIAQEQALETPEEIIAFWGSGYSDEMYHELEQRRQYWMSKFPEGTELDVGTEALIRQICSLELDINRDRIAGKSVDKSVNALNNLLGSANLKPTQQKADGDSAQENTPFGVWIRRWETKRPVPDPDPELEDVDGIIRYISIWFLGHLCKMLGIKNTYCRLYEEEIAKMRVDRPEYEDEDDETLFNDIFGGSNSVEENESDG
ncbi:MAG: hypothetical protein Q4F79_00340 [Eubacteriales bacterium]|nr:hypothetical protein [Eubacteriales bacterium]